MTRPRNFSGGAKPRAPMCPCGQSLATGAKTFWDGAWRCERCTYKRDYPNAEILQAPRRRAAPLQEETLFRLPTRNPDHGE